MPSPDQQAATNLPPDPDQQPSPDQLPPDPEWLQRQLRHFLDAEGRLTSYPAKFKRKVFALYLLASHFEPGRDYTEAEVNELLQCWHSFDDWAMLRRELYNKHFLDRTADGATYWLQAKQPALADFGL